MVFMLLGEGDYKVYKTIIIIIEKAMQLHLFKFNGNLGFSRLSFIAVCFMGI